MKKLVVTSSGMVGEIHVVYDADCRLAFIDFQGAQLRDDQIGFFKGAVPVLYTNKTVFNEPFKGKLTITEEGYDVSFEMFWARYNHKINRLRCEKLWDKLSGAKRLKAYVGIQAYHAHLSREGWKNKMGPERWLKEEQWETDWRRVR